MNVHPHRLRLLPPLLVAVFLGGPTSCGEASDDLAREVRVDVAEVIRDVGGNPVILLHERDGDRTLPIWIGLSEARSIATRLEKVEPPRPNTHDLAKSLIAGLGADVDRVLVTELRERTYYGLIVLTGPGGRIEIDSRPSDAIALALRLDAPIFVRETLFEEASEKEEDEPPPGQEVRRSLPRGSERI